MPRGTVLYTKGNGERFTYDQNDATNRSASFGNFQNQVLGVNRLADVYEAHLQAGVTYHFIMNSFTSNTDLGLNLYPANDPSSSGGFYSRWDATYLPGAAVGQAVGVTSDVIGSYTAPVDGYYPVVVYRQTGANALSPATYSLVWNTGVVGVSSQVENEPLTAFLTLTEHCWRGRRLYAALAPKALAPDLFARNLSLPRFWPCSLRMRRVSGGWSQRHPRSGHLVLGVGLRPTPNLSLGMNGYLSALVDDRLILGAHGSNACACSSEFEVTTSVLGVTVYQGCIQRVAGPPVPCETVPTVRTTWGSIKSRYQER